MKERILEAFKNEPNAIDLIEINDRLGLKTAEELKELSTELDILVEDFLVYKTKKDKYMLFENCNNLKIGRLSVNKKGFGFVILDKEDDIYINKEDLNGATHDDVVVVEITGQGLKREGRILKVAKREFKNLVGEVFIEDGRVFLDLDDDKKDLKIEIVNSKDLVDGHKVMVEIVKELSKKSYLAEVLVILGHKNDPGVDILSIAYKYGIYPEFSDEVMAEVEAIPNEVSDDELVGRIDLTDKEIFTIDGDDTKDIDDAISLEIIDGNYRLGVHIADVSNYVKEGTFLGDEAFNRGTSSYLADTVIPMLPHKLSNGICSLNPDVVRLSMSCVMDINEQGKVVKYDIFPSIIKSRKQMTYKKVNDIIERNIVAEDYEPYKDTILKLKELADILRNMKVKRGYIDFELDEAKIVQDKSGKAIDVVRRVRESGEMMIEDFMICANECVAEHVYNMKLPFIYRIHTEPKPERINDFANFVKILGYRINDNMKDVTPYSMQKILASLSEKKEFEILSSMLLRSMQKAEYSADNLGHFGLASRCYTHFTSPIRRFPDLTVHRMLKKYFVDNNYNLDGEEQKLTIIASQSSEREVAAVQAERDVDDMKKAEYMESHIGEEFDGIIDTVTNFGFFVELPNLIEGLVHVNNLKGDYFNYVEDQLAMIGKSTKKRYQIGDEIRVKCIAASKEQALIDFEVVEKEK